MNASVLTRSGGYLIATVHISLWYSIAETNQAMLGGDIKRNTVRMKEQDLKIACIGAGNSGTNHMIWFEQGIPGSMVTFCDLNRTLFDSVLDGYFGKSANIAGDFKQDASGLKVKKKVKKENV